MTTIPTLRARERQAPHLNIRRGAIAIAMWELPYGQPLNDTILALNSSHFAVSVEAEREASSTQTRPAFALFNICDRITYEEVR